MFRQKVESLRDVLLRNLREQGLETPLLQKRLVEAWPQVVGPVIARYTLNTYIYNQTLFVRLSNPALRSDLSMMRTELVKKLNDVAGQQIIVDIRFN
jgi:predicted nucleic acid-binding Zn ribbon protein